MDSLYWALWGLLGAFVYAAPRLLVAWGDSKATEARLWVPASEFVVALAFGPIFSVGFGPFAATRINLGSIGVEGLRAVALVIGLVANPIAPLIVKWATGDILRRLGGTNKRNDEP